MIQYVSQQMHYFSNIKKIFHITIIVPCLLIFTSGCRDDIDILIKKGAFEIACYFYSSGKQADKYTGITLVINKNGGAIQREERSVAKSSANKSSITKFQVNESELKQLYGILSENYFFGIKSKHTMNLDARTIHLRIKAGGSVYILEENSATALATTADRQKFYTIIKKICDFTRTKLPHGREQTIDF
jgi:hypothetical protein